MGRGGWDRPQRDGPGSGPINRYEKCPRSSFTVTLTSWRSQSTWSTHSSTPAFDATAGQITVPPPSPASMVWATTAGFRYVAALHQKKHR